MKKITQLFCLSIILFYPIYKTGAQCNVFLAGIKNVTCNGACDGTANALTFGGTAPYTYSWSGGQTSANVTNFCAGVYTLTVKDANTCNITTVATILQAPVLKGTTSTTNAKCNTPGTATITATGGSSPYFFTWNPGGKTGSTISAGAGIYTVTLRDSYGCIKVYIDTIGSDPGAITTAASQVNISCNGLSNGSIAVSPSGGTSPYTYSWSPGGQTTSSGTGLSTGIYNVTITDAGGCTSSRSFLITQPPAITLGGGFGLIGVPAKCNGSNTGSINATTSGGTSPYTYIWSNGATTQLNSGIGAGTYTVTVYDANSCSRTGTATVTEPAVLTVTTTSTTTTATANPTGGTPTYSYSWSNAGSTKTITGLGFGIYTVTVTDLNGCSKTATATVVATCNVTVNGVKNVTCNGACDGTATALAAGTAPYTYSWSGGQTTSSVTNLCAGTFTVSVTDALSCVSTSTTTILQAPALTATITSTNAKCNTLGTASINASGGSAPYTYSWSPGGKITSTITAGAGIYTVTLRDNYGCVKMFTDTVKSDPGAITTTASQTNISCNAASNGSISITPSGGTTPYTYTWNPGGQTTATTLTGLNTGTYIVTIVDAIGCTSNRSFIITQPAPIIFGGGAGLLATPAKCNGESNGSINAPTSGGTTPYTYSWSNGATTQLNSGIGAGTYVLTVADANSCTRTASATVTEPPILAVTTTTTTNSATANPTGGTPAYTYLWSNAGNTKTITGLGFGTYTVTVTDKNGCLQTATATVVAICNVTLNGIKNITCNGACDGTAIALATGTAPYTFAWSGGQTTANATNLCAGSFTVSVTDANACVSTSASAILQPPVLTATVSSTNAKCNTLGTASITASGGSAPYTYSWSPGGKTTSTISAGAGIYTVTLRDVNGCVKMFTDTVKSDPGAITSSASQTNISCNGGSNGSITITPSGGTAPYTYTWNPGGQTTSTTLTGLSLGTYIVTIADAIGCTSNRSFIITQPAPILFGGGAGLLAAPAKCNGESNGSINAPTSGGTSPYTYSWSNGATTQLNSGIGAGTYILTVTDGNGCTKTASATVSEPPVLVVTTTTATNTATANPVGGTTPYTYTWNNGANTKTITGLLSGTYTVTVTDKNGCSSSSTATILTTYINAANSESGLKIYPNPVSTYLTVELSFENNSAIKITVLNILGEIISDENLTASKTFKKSMDVSGLTDGIYFINIKSENQSYTQKFIINR